MTLPHTEQRLNAPPVDLPGEVVIVNGPRQSTIAGLCDADRTTVAKGKVADGSRNWSDNYLATVRGEYNVKRVTRPRKRGKGAGGTAYRHQEAKGNGHVD